MNKMNNRYVIILPLTNDELAWNPSNSSDLPIADCAYIGRVLVAMEQDGTIRDLTFYITWNLDHLPSYGPNVIAIVLGDEWCRLPRYALRVRAIFKTHGTSVSANWTALTRPSAYQLLALAQDLRAMLCGLPNRIAFGIACLKMLARGKLPHWRISVFPLGYYRQLPVPFTPIKEREFGVYFAGSVSNQRGLSRLFPRLAPKLVSRAKMIRRLKQVGASNPELAISTLVTSGFHQTTSDDAMQYSHMMMQSKICLVPRGSSLETFRYCEGLRFGCVVISERLPQRWFYDAAPIFRIREWSELEQLIPTLLRDADQLEKLSRASLAWWSEQCSEEAVGRYFAKQLKLHSSHVTRRSSRVPAETN